MRIMFSKDVTLNKISDIDCFSGMYKEEQIKYKKHEVIEILSIDTGDKIKRRHKEGGPYTLDTIYLSTSKYNMNKDFLDKVKSCDYVILD